MREREGKEEGKRRKKRNLNWDVKSFIHDRNKRRVAL